MLRDRAAFSKQHQDDAEIRSANQGSGRVPVAGVRLLVAELSRQRGEVEDGSVFRRGRSTHRLASLPRPVT